MLEVESNKKKDISDLQQSSSILENIVDSIESMEICEEFGSKTSSKYSHTMFYI